MGGLAISHEAKTQREEQLQQSSSRTSTGDIDKMMEQSKSPQQLRAMIVEELARSELKLMDDPNNLKLIAHVDWMRGLKDYVNKSMKESGNAGGR